MGAVDGAEALPGSEEAGRTRLCKVNGAYTESIEAVLDAGAPSPRVSVKDLTHAYPSFGELSICKFPLKYFDAKVVLPQPADDVDDGQIFTLQANFISGGLILCAMSHHSFVDAQGLAVLVQQLGAHLVAGQAAPRLSAESIDRRSIDSWDSLQAGRSDGPVIELAVRCRLSPGLRGILASQDQCFAVQLLR